MTTIRLRGGTMATAPAGLVLAAREPAVEYDSGRMKIGDGVTAWAALRYVDDAALDAALAAIAAVVNGAPAGGDTLAELHARIAAVEALGSLATDAELVAQVAALVGAADPAGDTLGELQALTNLRMTKAANLSDVANVVTARANLSVYSTAQVDAAVAAEGALRLAKAANLSDVANPATARGNLAVYSSAQVDAADALRLLKAGIYAAAGAIVASRRTGDAADRMTIDRDGRIELGAGAGATDVAVYRSNVGALRLDGRLGLGVDAGANVSGSISRQVIDVPAGNENALTIRVPDTVDDVYGTNQAIQILKPTGLATDGSPAGAIMTRINRKGGLGLMGIHVAPGLRVPGATGQAVWIEPYADVTGLVINNPPTADVPVWAGAYMIVADRNASQTIFQIRNTGGVNAYRDFSARTGATTQVFLGDVGGLGTLAFGATGESMLQKDPLAALGLRANVPLTSDANVSARMGGAAQTYIGDYFGSPGLGFGTGVDAAVWRSAAGIVGVTSAFEFVEMAAPAAPAANRARLFSRDNGAGKTQLCVVFNTGAIAVLATQP